MLLTESDEVLARDISLAGQRNVSVETLPNEIHVLSSLAPDSIFRTNVSTPQMIPATIGQVNSHRRYPNTARYARTSSES